MKKTGRVSIKTISEMTGYSTATVSRVINQAGGFSPQTGERVRAAILEAGFVPNAMARGLRTNSLPLVGVIVPDIINEYFSKIVLRVQLDLWARGYSVFICNTDESPRQEETYLETLRTMMIRGLICISGHSTTVESWPGVPTVYIDRHPVQRAERSTIIESDNLSGGYQAADEVLRRGCRRVAILLDERNLSTCVDRYEGYRRALTAVGAPVLDDLRLTVRKVDFHSGLEAVSRALEAGRRFDALFCTTDWLALGALEALRAAGVSVPGAVRVVGYDDISISRYCALPFTTIHQDVEEMSRLAVEELCRMMDGKDCLRDHWIVPVSLVRRGTT